MKERDSRVDHPVLHACRDLVRAVDLFDEAACAVLGVGRSDLRALNLLEDGPVTASALAQGLGLTRPAVTALVDRLAAAGFVHRVPVPGDRRATGVALQPATWEAFARVYRPLGLRVRAAIDSLPAAEQAALGRALALLGEVFRTARSTLVQPEGTTR